MEQPANAAVIPFVTIFLLWLTATANGLPEDLDSFLEVLFDTSQCEDFLSSGEWLSVATRDCPPYSCDFPRQLCMRPSEKFKEESANQCKNIPEPCLTAANKGIPLGAPPPPVPIFTTPPPIASFLSQRTDPPLKLVTIGPNVKETNAGRNLGLSGANICDLGQPQGRFCGFAVKVAYNRETYQCEQFWFPGCTTAETNANLFDNEEQCLEATRSCRAVPSVAPPVPQPPPPTAPPPAPSPPPAPVPAPLPPAPSPSPFNIRNWIPGGSLPAGSMVPPPGQMGAGNQAALLGLITNGISQFTGASGSGGSDGGGFFNFNQIPQLIQSFQSARGRR